MNIFIIILIVLGCLIAVSSTLYILLTMFWMIGFKIYRKVKYKMSLYD
ncbi:MAG: hypothetical protein ACLRVQ_00785 [Lachnospiraceae bacterium]